jgi:16S rRNA processing protein RimM
MPTRATAMTRRDDTGNDNALPATGPFVRVGRILGARGVRGELRVHSDTADPRDIVAYGPVYSHDGRQSFRLTVMDAAGATLVARIVGVTDRNGAEALKGLDLYVPRAALPAPGAEEYYHADLAGLAAVRADGSAFGTVIAAHDFGAGDMLEIDRGAGDTVLIPFTAAAVPVVDIAGGRVVVAPPAGLLDPADPQSASPQSASPQSASPQSASPQSAGPEEEAP